jgi:hypothetical protein
MMLWGRQKNSSLAPFFPYFTVSHLKKDSLIGKVAALNIIIQAFISDRVAIALLTLLSCLAMFSGAVFLK